MRQSAPGIGVITSAVLMSDTRDEIDWEWSGNDFNQSQPTVQTNYYGKGITGHWDRGTQPRVGPNMTQGCHTYTIDWTPDALTWSLDGVVLRTLLAKDCDSADHQYPQTPSRFHLGLWDAGGPDVPEYTVLWAGGYTDLAGVPYTAYVKSVSITPRSPCDKYQYTDKSGSAGSVKCLQASVLAASSYSQTGPRTPAGTTSVKVSTTVVQEDTTDCSEEMTQSKSSSRKTPSSSQKSSSSSQKS